MALQLPVESNYFFNVSFVPRRDLRRVSVDMWMEQRMQIIGRAMVERPVLVALQKLRLNRDATQQSVANTTNYQIDYRSKVLVFTNRHINNRRYAGCNAASIVWERFPNYWRIINDCDSFIYMCVTMIGNEFAIQSNINAATVFNDNWLKNGLNRGVIARRRGSALDLVDNMRIFISYGIEVPLQALPPAAAAAPASSASSSASSSTSTEVVSSSTAAPASAPVVVPSNRRRIRKRNRAELEGDSSGSDNDGAPPPPKRARLLAPPETIQDLKKENSALTQNLAVSKELTRAARAKTRQWKRFGMSFQRSVLATVGPISIVKSVKGLSEYIGF